MVSGQLQLRGTEAGAAFSFLSMHEGRQMVTRWMLRRLRAQLPVSFPWQKRQAAAHLKSSTLAVRPQLVLGHSALETSSPSVHIHKSEGIDQFDADGLRCLIQWLDVDCEHSVEISKDDIRQQTIAYHHQRSSWTSNTPIASQYRRRHFNRQRDDPKNSSSSRTLPEGFFSLCRSTGMPSISARSRASSPGRSRKGTQMDDGLNNERFS